MPARVADRRDRQRHVDRPVRPLQPRPSRSDRRVRRAGGETGSRLLPIGDPGDEHPNRLADELGGGVAEDAFRGCVAGLDDAVQILRDDGVIRRVDDGRQICLRARRLLCAGDISLRAPDPV